MLLPFYADLATTLLEGRRGVPKNHAKAYAVASLGASLGCPHCKGALARCRLGGFGCPENVDEAERLAKESADAGSRYGYFVLGYLAFDEGHVELAKKHWQKAADLGLAVAQVNLAKLYLCEAQNIKYDVRLGQGSERAILDVLFLEADAFDLLLMACQKGHPIAWQELGTMYMYGTYVDLNMDYASACFTRSRKAGNVQLLLV